VTTQVSTAFPALRAHAERLDAMPEFSAAYQPFVIKR
jgi:hypothetical protein